jgi:hypothetical protein
MKSFKTLAEATRRAAESGATLDIGGRLVNAAGTRLAVVPQPRQAAAQPTPAPAPQPDPVDRLVELVAAQTRLAAAQGETVTRMVSEVLERLAPAPAPPAPAAVAAPRQVPVLFDVVWEGGEWVRLTPTYGPAPSSAVPTHFDFLKDAGGRTVQVIPIYPQEP